MITEQCSLNCNSNVLLTGVQGEPGISLPPIPAQKGDRGDVGLPGRSAEPPMKGIRGDRGDEGIRGRKGGCNLCKHLKNYFLHLKI